MLCHSPPVIRKLPEPIIAGDRKQQANTIMRPLSPSGHPSPKSWKINETEGIGLAIVAALDRMSDEYSVKNVTGLINYDVTAPIPIVTTRNNAPRACADVGLTTSMSLCSEENKDCGNLRCDKLFDVAEDVEFLDFQVADFLSYCHLCQKRLYGKDIYIYRGEKAFCSMECRQLQIINDEHQEKCGTKASNSSEISSSPYSGQLFFTGIVVS